MTSDTPQTEAGRSFAGRLWAVSDYAGASQAISGVFHDVRAIEDESRNAALTAAAETVERLRDTIGGPLDPSNPLVKAETLDLVLAALASLRKPVTP